MKNQALFSLKDKSKKFKCHLLQFLCGSLRVKAVSASPHHSLTLYQVLASPVSLSIN